MESCLWIMKSNAQLTLHVLIDHGVPGLQIANGYSKLLERQAIGSVCKTELLAPVSKMKCWRGSTYCRITSPPPPLDSLTHESMRICFF